MPCPPKSGRLQTIKKGKFAIEIFMDLTCPIYIHIPFLLVLHLIFLVSILPSALPPPPSITYSEVSYWNLSYKRPYHLYGNACYAKPVNLQGQKDAFQENFSLKIFRLMPYLFSNRMGLCSVWWVDSNVRKMRARTGIRSEGHSNWLQSQVSFFQDTLLQKWKERQRKFLQYFNIWGFSKWRKITCIEGPCELKHIIIHIL